MNRLSFDVADNKGAVAITPAVDGISLSALVTEFERASGYLDPAGGYGGIVPAFFSYGPLDSYFRGEGRNPVQVYRADEIYLLGCDCGEVGCWPLMASVVQTEQGYRWEGFHQPHRPNRNYSAFGPFDFERQQYDYEIELLLQAV